MMPEPEENRLDQSLRDKFEDFNLEPSAPVWAGIEQRIGAPVPAPGGRRRPPVPLPLLVGLVALLSGLAGWLLPHGAAPGRPLAAGRPVAGEPARRVGEGRQTLGNARLMLGEGHQTLGEGRLMLGEGRQTLGEGRLTLREGRQTFKQAPQIVEKGLQMTGKPILTLGASVSRIEPPVSFAGAAFPDSVAASAALAMARAGIGAARPDSTPATLRPLAAFKITHS